LRDFVTALVRTYKAVGRIGCIGMFSLSRNTDPDIW